MPATTPRKPEDEEVRWVRADMIVGQSTIAQRFNISLQAAWNWTQRPDFPAPLPADCGRPIWDWEEVQNWEKNWVRSKGGYHTHKNPRGEPSNGSRRPRRQWKEGDPE